MTPEEANQIGYDFASRFLKGKHAFFVCTHTDKAHIHNHIYWNAVTIDCKKKFRDFRRSHRAVSRLSDLICTEHQLSVIDKPQRGSSAYNKWHGFKGKPSHREFLRIAIDEALEQKPHDFDAFLALLAEQGFSQKRKTSHFPMPTSSKISVCTIWVMSIPRMRSVRSLKVKKSISPSAEWCDANRPQSIIDICQTCRR